MALIIRSAHPGEKTALTDLCLRSKAHWGYDEDFMRLCVPVLMVTAEQIASGAILVAEEGGRVLGLISASVDSEGGDGFWELALCFVEPEAMGKGIGRALFESQRAWLAVRRAKRLSILADPGAEPFYRRMGAKRIGEAPSDAIPGRLLPLLELML